MFFIKNVRNYFFAISAVAMLAFEISGCDDKKESNKIVFVTSVYPPFEFSKDGEFYGFDIDVAREIAKEIGKEAEFKDMGFDLLIEEVKNGRADASIASISITEERKKQVDMSESYYFGGMAIIYRKSTPYATIEELSGKKVAVQLGSTMEKWAKNHAPKDAQIVPMNWPAELIESLKSKNVDAVITDSDVAATFCEKNAELANVIAGQSDDGIGIVTKKGSPLSAKIADALAKIKQNGTLEKIRQKWFKKK